MMKVAKRNIGIDGMGSIAGGEYENVNIDGMGKLKNNIICTDLSIDGLFKVKGEIQAVHFNCDGMARVFRDMKCQEVNVDGLLKIRRAKLEANKIKCDGFVVCNRELSADDININGYCSVSKIFGDKVTIKTNEEQISFKMPKKFSTIFGLYFGRKIDIAYSLVDTIECTELKAKFLKAKVIKANKITLGENCIVDRIECSGDFKCHPSSKVTLLNGKQYNKNNKGEGENMDQSLEKILNMFKKDQLKMEEAKELIKALKSDENSANENVAANSEPLTYDFNDDKLRFVVFNGNKLVSQHKLKRNMKIEVEYQGDVKDVECWGNLKCSNVEGSANAGTHIVCGDVKGDAHAGTHIQCGDLEGSASAGTHIQCGDVKGDISAGTGVKMIRR